MSRAEEGLGYPPPLCPAPPSLSRDSTIDREGRVQRVDREYPARRSLLARRGAASSTSYYCSRDADCLKSARPTPPSANVDTARAFVPTTGKQGYPPYVMQYKRTC
jgi:hypothetical protein